MNINGRTGRSTHYEINTTGFRGRAFYQLK